jgi:glutathione S-transferase
MRVQVVLEELGREYELVPVSLGAGEHKTPEHLARQPFGKVPALEDGDLTLFESRTICRYLAKGTPLAGGEDAHKAALVDNWLEVEGHNYGPPVGAVVYEKVFRQMFGGEPDESIIDKNLSQLERVLDVYESRLRDHKYLAGDELSIADLSHLPYTVYLIEKGGVVEPFENRPNVWRWLTSLRELPSWQRVWKTE